MLRPGTPSAYSHFGNTIAESDNPKLDSQQTVKFTIPFFIAYRLFLLCQNSTVYIVTRKENFDTVKKTGQIPVETLEEAWSLAQKQLAERGLKDYTVNIMQHAANTVPMID